MRLAILSDLHANPFALRAVLPEIRGWAPDRVLCAGDVLGYYPWAQETCDLVQSLDPWAVLGNHDRWVLDSLGLTPEAAPAETRPPYYDVARQNGLELTPQTKDWLRSLPLTLELTMGAWRLTMVHGTPANPLEGRYYPDDATAYPWLPGRREVLILGHTHYPLQRRTASGGWVLNPGSVGQPRQGSPRPTWLAIDWAPDAEPVPELRFAVYDPTEPMRQLVERQWPARFVAALNKTTPGPLRWAAPDPGSAR